MKTIYKYENFQTNEAIDINDLKVGQTVEYRKDTYDDSKSADEQKDKIVTKPVERIDKENNKIYFKDHQGNEFSKSISEINIVDKPKENEPAKAQETNVEKQLEEELGVLKSNPSKLKNVLDYVTFIKHQK
ncbi:hypothetical protein ACI6Q2_13585 [Chitinophagaceae bacterium LWZ2-11]